MGNKHEELANTARKLGIGSYGRHVLLCLGPNCCSHKEGEQAWDTLKKQLKEHELDRGENPCYRTKVGCLRICSHGPILLVYPEGTWYEGMTAERIPHFVQRHLIEGKPVEEWIFARNPLSEES